MTPGGAGAVEPPGAAGAHAAGVELLDHPECLTTAEVAENLADIARLNRLGATRAIVAEVAAFVRHPEARRPLHVLDLGTGGADVPVALTRWAHARGHDVRILGVDWKPEVLACARRATRGQPGVRLLLADARRLPLRPGSVDVTLCSLLLHHLREDEVVTLLGAMMEASRLGFVVSDLRRGRLAYLAAWLATRAISGNRVTRHDGPLSVRRAYTLAELRRLSAAAGLATIRWRRSAPFRVIGAYRRGTSRDG